MRRRLGAVADDHREPRALPRATSATTTLPARTAQRITARFDELLATIEAEPKSRGWKLRAKIGERKRWYELPEEV